MGRLVVSQPVIKTPNTPTMIEYGMRKNNGDLHINCRFIAYLLVSYAY